MVRRNYSWPLFLIFLGGVFLLNTTGVLGWDIWMYMIRFWPVLIVIVGINIILGSSVLARLLEVVSTLALLLFVLAISFIQYTGQPLSFLPSNINEWVLKGGSGMFNLARDVVEEDFWVSADEYEGIQKRRFEIQMGASSFSVEDSQDVTELILINSTYPKTFEPPVLSRELKEDTLDISVMGASSKSFNLFGNESEYTVSIGQPTIPSDFDINLGAGKGEILFKQLLVEEFIAEVGAGRLKTEFELESLPSGDIRYIIGAGKVDLVLPQRVGYVVEYDLGVGSIKINGEDVSGISGGRGKYKSRNFDESEYQISMFVTVGVGTFNIETK